MLFLLLAVIDADAVVPEHLAAFRTDVGYAFLVVFVFVEFCLKEFLLWMNQLKDSLML